MTRTRLYAIGRWILTPTLGILLMVGCGKDNSPPDSTPADMKSTANPNSPGTPGDGSTAGNTGPNGPSTGQSPKNKLTAGELLFQTNLAPTQLAANRLLFTQTRATAPSSSSGGHELHQLDVQSFELDLMMVPQTPLFATYHEPQGSVSLAIKLPQDFWPNIPQDIQAELKKRDIKSLDLFIVIQKYIVGTYHVHPQDVVRFRPHFWVGPAGPHAPTLNVAGNLDVALYDFDQAIDADLKTKQLTSINWSIHPGNAGGMPIALYSPPNAMVNMPRAKATNSGWSLAIDEPGARAAVTLHGTLSDAPFANSPHARFEAILATHHTLDTIMAAMAADPAFAPLLTRMTTLVQ